jgi:Family of unknown function (DUF6508)
MWGSSSYPSFSGASVDRMLAFLPEFERGDFATALQYYKATGKDLPQVERLCSEVYRSGFVFPFDWLAWKKQEASSALTTESVARADMLSLRKIMTACVRQDRFCGGFLSSVCSSGLVKRVLERLRDLQTTVAEVQTGGLSGGPDNSVL